MESSHVVVVGAGVLGLTCALQLCRKGHRVIIIARDLPGDLTIEYSSPWAGAHFRPVPITNATEEFEQGLIKETYHEFSELASSDSSTGIDFIPGVEYFDTPSKAYTDLRDEAGFNAWPDFRVLGQDELPGGGQGPITWGVTYTSWVINTPVYLAWLQREIQLLGGKVIRRCLSALPEAIFIAREYLKSPDEKFRAVINASGMGFEDPDCFPSRGQFLLVSNPCDRTISYQTADGEATVVIPRPLNGGTLIGGTKEINNWSHTPSEAATAGILEKVAKLCPQLLRPPPFQPNGLPGLHVLNVNIGRRPMRSSGFRLEKQELSVAQTKADGFKNELVAVKVIHCYGAGGNGYKLSWGAARKVFDLICED